MTDQPLYEYIDLEAYDVVPGTQYRKLLEQLEALNETLRLITEAAGDDGTAADDWRANTDKPKTALFAVRELRKDYDEAIGVSNPASGPEAAWAKSANEADERGDQPEVPYGS